MIEKDDWIMIEHRQMTQVGEGMPYPRKDGKLEEPDFKFVFTGLRCYPDFFKEIGHAEASRQINHILKLATDGTIVGEFDDDYYNDQIVRTVLRKGHEYFKEE